MRVVSFEQDSGVLRTGHAAVGDGRADAAVG